MLTKRTEKKLDGKHKNIMSYIEQILEATPHETAAGQPLISYP